MRRAMAIVCSVVLALTLFVLPGEATTKSSKCPGCSCANACCVSQSAPAPTPLPAPPTAPTSLKQQICPVPAVAVLRTAQLAPLAFSFSSYLFLPKAGLVPLYERNCAYLI